MRRIFAAVGIVLLAGSCDPRTFDDLADSTWVEVADRKDTQTGGDFGIGLLALPAPSEGASFIVAAGSPPGLAQITLNAKGKVAEQIGYNGELNGKGVLDPLDNKNSPSGLGLLSGDKFLVGVKDTPMVIQYGPGGLASGVRLLPVTGMTAPSLMGLAVASGNVGVGGAADDVVVLGQLSLTILPDGLSTMTPIVCSFKAPDSASSPAVFHQNLVLTKINAASDHSQIVVSSRDLQEDPWILILEASSIQNGQPCPFTGFRVPVTAPVAIAVADLDGNGTPDFVTGTAVKNNENFGYIRLYMNVTGPGDYSPVEIAPSTETSDQDNMNDASRSRGAQIVIGNIDEDPKDEIVIADPGVSVNGVGAAGKVYVFRYGACSTDDMRGPLCLVRTLHHPSPTRNDAFGRAMQLADFKSSKGTRKVLAVAQKAKLWVYFKFSESAADPRD